MSAGTWEGAYRDLRAAFERLRDSLQREYADGDYSDLLSKGDVVDMLTAALASPAPEPHTWDPDSPCACGSPSSCPATPAPEAARCGCPDSRDCCGADADLTPITGGLAPEAVTEDDLTVCIEHGAFIPCRKAGYHYYSQNPFWVKSVRDYHASTVDGLTWEPASEYAARKMTPAPAVPEAATEGYRVSLDTASGEIAVSPARICPCSTPPETHEITAHPAPAVPAEARAEKAEAEVTSLRAELAERAGTEEWAVDYSLASGRTWINGWLPGYKSREAADKSAAVRTDGKVMHRFVSPWVAVEAGDDDE